METLNLTYTLKKLKFVNNFIHLFMVTIVNGQHFKLNSINKISTLLKIIEDYTDSCKINNIILRNSLKNKVI